MSERQGVEIDYCPNCRGVWLDRGELDKIIEKSVPGEPSQQYTKPEQRYYDDDHHKHDQKYGYGNDHNYDPRRRKKGGFLGDLFDF